MSKTIELKMTDKILEPWGLTVEDIATANKYQEKIINPDYVESVGDETMDDPDGETEEADGGIIVVKQVPNPEYKEAIGEPVIDNPDSHTVFISKRLPVDGFEKMIRNYMAPQITQARQSLADFEAQPALIAEEIASKLTKKVTE